MGYYRNISEERRQVLHLTQMAETDAMTGLFNRQAAIPRIEEYIQNIGDSSAAMVMFDLDNFKPVSYTHLVFSMEQRTGRSSPSMEDEF